MGFFNINTSSGDEMSAGIPDCQMEFKVEEGADAGNNQTELSVTLPSVVVSATIS